MNETLMPAGLDSHSPRSLLRPGLAALLLATQLTGCQALTVSDPAPEPVDDPMAGAPPVARGLDAEGLAGLLTAELAGQRGDYRRAAEGYLAVGERYASPELLERAVLAASFADDRELLARSAAAWQAQTPDAEAPARLLASLAMQRGDWTEALEHRLRLITLGGDSELTVFAEAALAEGADPAPLLALLYPHLERTPPDARRHDAELATALLEVAAGDLDLARQRLDRLGARAPELPALWLARAHLAQQRGDHAAARDAARHGLEVSPGDSRFMLMLAQSELRLGQHAAAEARIDALLDTHAGNRELRLGLAQLYLDEARPASARRLLLPLLDEPDTPAIALYLLGASAEAEGEVDDAFLYYRQVPDGSEFLPARLRAAEMLIANGRLHDARNFLHTERLRHARHASDLVALEVELLDREEHTTEANALLDQALARTPDDAGLRYLRAMRAWEAGDLAGMERDLKRIIEANPEHAMALNALGYTLIDLGIESRLDEAQTLIERAHDLDPDNPAILDSLGWVHFRQGDPEAALPWLERAYAAMPDQEIAAHLAEVLWALGRQDEARELIREAVERFDERPLIDDLLQRTPALTP